VDSSSPQTPAALVNKVVETPRTNRVGIRGDGSRSEVRQPGNVSPTFFQCWDLDEDLRAAEQIARNLRIHARHAGMLSESDFGPAGMAVPAVEKRPVAINSGWRRLLRIGSRAALAASLLLFLAAAALAAWSAACGDTLPWRIEMPLAMAGEAGLVLSLAAYVLSDAHRERAARDVMAQLDEQMRQLHGQADRRSRRPHFSNAANAHVMLAELKSRIEQLSEQLRNDD
jgi:hypothetical protein